MLLSATGNEHVAHVASLPVTELVGVLENVEASECQVIEAGEEELTQELGELDAEHDAWIEAIDHLVDEGEELAVFDLAAIFTFEKSVVYALKIMVNIHGQAVEGILLWRVEDVSLDKIIEIMGALALGTSRTVAVECLAKVILYRLQGSVLDDVVDNGQLVDLAMFWIVDIFGDIG